MVQYQFRNLKTAFPIGYILLIIVLFGTFLIYTHYPTTLSLSYTNNNLWWGLATGLSGLLVFKQLEQLFNKTNRTRLWVKICGSISSFIVLFLCANPLLINLSILYYHFLSAGICLIILAAIFNKNKLGKYIQAFLLAPYFFYYLVYTIFQTNLPYIIVIGLPFAFLILNKINVSHWLMGKPVNDNFKNILANKISRYCYISNIGLCLLSVSILTGYDYISAWTLLTFLIVPTAFIGLYYLIRAELDKETYLKKLKRNSNILLYSFIFWFSLGCFIAK